MKNIHFNRTPRWMLLVGIWGGVALGQTQIDFQKQLKNIDPLAAGATQPTPTGTQLPVKCTAGQQFFKLNEPAGGNLYLCNPANKWSQLLGLPPVGLANQTLVSDGTAPKWEFTKSENLPNFQPSIAGKVLTIEAGRASSGNTLCERGRATATITAGTGSAAGIKVYLDSACALHVDYPASAGLTIECAECVAGAVAMPSVPAGALFLAEAAAASGVWTTATDKRGALSLWHYTAGEGLMVDAPTGRQFNVDSTVARRDGSNVYTGDNDFSAATKTAPVRRGASDPATCDASAREMFYNTSSNTLKICNAANTWSPLVAQGSGSGGVLVTPDSTVKNELAIFADATGKQIGRMTGTGFVRVTNGVAGAVSGTAADCLRGDGSMGPCGAASGATTQTGAELPATCTAGSQFFKLDAPDSGNLYLCNPSDTWSQLVDLLQAPNMPVMPASSVINEVAVFADTTGKQIGRMTGTGFVRVTNGVAGAVSGTAADCLRGDGSMGPCGAGAASEADFQPSIAGKVLTIGAGRASSGNVLCERASATATITGGAGPAAGIKVYLDSACALHVDYPASAGLTIGCAECVAGAVAMPSVPAGALFLAEAAVSGGVWTTAIDKRGALSLWHYTAGEGLMVDAPTGRQFNVDSTVARRDGSNVYTGDNDFSAATKTAPVRQGASDPATCDASTREMFYNTSSNTLKICNAANTWSPLVAQGSGSGGVLVTPDSSVKNELAIFADTTGKQIGRMTGTGFVRVTNGVAGAVAGTAADCLRGDGSVGACGAASEAPILAGAFATNMPIDQVDWHVTVSPSSGRVYYNKWMLPFKMTVANFMMHIGTASAGATCRLGLYDSGGGLVVQSQPIDAGTSGMKNAAAVSPAVVGPGMYLWAYGCTSSEVTALGAASPSTFWSAAFDGSLSGVRYVNTDMDANGLPAFTGSTGMNDSAWLPAFLVY